MGTKFIATRESLASDAYREMVVRANAEDIVLTKAITGLETNILAKSLVDAGIEFEAAERS
jgi:nitronate monooxygenase